MVHAILLINKTLEAPLINKTLEAPLINKTPEAMGYI
jgi:hypothetical protein